MQSALRRGPQGPRGHVASSDRRVGHASSGRAHRPALRPWAGGRYGSGRMVAGR